MVSFLGPAFSNIIMGYIELKVITAFKNKLLYLRYFDDCFVLVSSKKTMDQSNLAITN